MRNIFIVILLISSFLAGQDVVTTPSTSKSDQLPIAVLTLEGKGVSSQEAEILTERLRSALVQDGRYQIVERSQMEAILEEQGFQQSGCSTNECLVKAGLILGVFEMVGGTVGRIGNSYAIDIRLFNVESAAIVMAVSRNYQGEIDGLLGIMPEIAAQLAGEKSTGSTPVAAARVLLTEEDVKTGIDALEGAFIIAGQAIEKSFQIAGEAMDTTARTVRKLFTPKPKDPDIARGRRQGKLDAHDYQRKFTWLVTPLVPAFIVAASSSDEGTLVSGLFAGWLAMKIYAIVEGEPALPLYLVEKISSESVVFQENYRQSWIKEIESRRSKRSSAGCILGVTIGLLVSSN